MLDKGTLMELVMDDMEKDREQLERRCLKACFDMRKMVLRMSLSAGSAGSHLGGSLSMVELLAVIYLAVLRFDCKNPSWEGRDRFILSKGHGAPALYAILCLVGYIPENDLAKFKSDETYLNAHPSKNLDKGIEFSSGSLGQGLSLGVGSAIALKKFKGDQARVFVMMGDGELNEGSVWEAAMSAAHFKLSNLIAIVDKNGLQQDGPTAHVMDLGDLSAKWRSFGWNVQEVDGHDVRAILDAFQHVGDGPTVIIANTVKGKGAGFAENNRAWHHSIMTQKQFDGAMANLESAEREALQ